MDASRHLFIFSPGKWSGEGKILLNMVEEELIFNTAWNVETKDFTGKIQCFQDIQIHGLSEGLRNELSFVDFQNKKFVVEMENPNIGRISGTGIYDDKMIGWEFRGNSANFEGFETYQLQPDGSYLMKGEYVTADQFRTQIEAKLWLNASEPPNEEDINGGDSP